jgi:hypothetical protein
MCKCWWCEAAEIPALQHGVNYTARPLPGSAQMQAAGLPEFCAVRFRLVNLICKKKEHWTLAVLEKACGLLVCSTVWALLGVASPGQTRVSSLRGSISAWSLHVQYYCWVCY